MTIIILYSNPFANINEDNEGINHFQDANTTNPQYINPLERDGKPY